MKPKICQILFALTFALLTAGAAVAQVNADTPGYFPFTQPLLDTAPSFTDMSFLNPEPAGAAGFITVKDGQFLDGHGQRIRFLGTNVTFQGAFPEKAQAEAIAGHLRKYGFNVIRFHHMDSSLSPRGLRVNDAGDFDPAQLDKMDWFIYQLNQHGIYANINLHVGWTYPGMGRELARAWRYGKGLDNFHAPFIALQKDYARRLLTHVNPYAKCRNAENPGVAFVEINNENSLTNIPLAEFPRLPEPFNADLTRQWNAWLKGKYGDTTALRAVWNAASEPMGAEMITNGDFANGLENWSVQQSGGGRLEARVVAEQGVPGGKALRLEAVKPGDVSWALQFHQNSLNLEHGRRYTVAFWARGDRTRRIQINVRLDQEPWNSVGLMTPLEIGTQWKLHTIQFKCIDPVAGHGRITFDLQNEIGTLYLADVSLRPGGEVGLKAGETLEEDSVPLLGGGTEDVQRADFLAFISQTENDYFAGMVRYLKDELGVRAPISGTQASYGGAFGVYREAAFADFIDMHGYWEHPRFPGTAWDRNNWNIPNTSMTTSPTGGVPGSRAWLRVYGMPFTVSEYDHPAPNDHSAEMMPMYASFAAFQDWDGIYSFSYLNRAVDDGGEGLNNFFEQATHPAKMCFMPVAAVMFRMGAVARGAEPLIATLSDAGLAAQIAEDGDPYRASALENHLAAAATRRVGTRIDPGSRGFEAPAAAPPLPERVSDTFQLRWHPGAPAAYTVNAPAVRAAVGTIGGRKIELGDVSITVTRAEDDWASVAVCALDGKPLDSSSKILAVAVGRVENQDMGWDAKRTTVGTKWGHGPVVAEGITAAITLPGTAQAAALDGLGMPKGPVDTTTANGVTTFECAPEHATLWYAITRP